MSYEALEPRSTDNRLTLETSYEVVRRSAVFFRFRKTSALTNPLGIVCFNSSGGDGALFNVYLNTGTTLQAKIAGAITAENPISADGGDGNWHTVLFLENDSGVDVYYDSGVAPLVNIPMSAFMLPQTADRNSIFAEWRADGSYGFAGPTVLVADVGLWGRAGDNDVCLDQTAIDALFAGGVPADVTPEVNSTLYYDYPFRTDDLTNDGSVAGATWSVSGNPQFNAENPGAAPGPVAPTFIGPDIPNQSGEVDQPFSLDVSGLFDPGDGTPLGNGGWGLSPISGLSISAVGVIEGSPDTVGSAINRNVSFSTDAGTVQSNEFNFETTAGPAPGVTVYTVAADPVAGTDSILEGSGCGIGNDVEVPDQTVQGDAITWYTPFDGTFLIDNATGQKTFTARSRVDSGSAWTPAATFTVN